jgi:phage terminase small subunit
VATAPKTLAAAGRKLWKQAVAALPEEWELDERGEAVLMLAARQADDLAKLEKAIKGKGAMVKGSQGQPVVNPAIAEARQARLAISRLLGTLPFDDVDPEKDAKPKDTPSMRGRRAARARWRQENG